MKYRIVSSTIGPTTITRSSGGRGAAGSGCGPSYCPGCSGSSGAHLSAADDVENDASRFLRPGHRQDGVGTLSSATRRRRGWQHRSHRPSSSITLACSPVRSCRRRPRPELLHSSSRRTGPGRPSARQDELAGGSPGRRPATPARAAAESVPTSCLAAPSPHVGDGLVGVAAVTPSVERGEERTFLADGQVGYTLGSCVR